MSHKGIRLLIQDTAKSLGDDIQFTYARPSDFNVLRDKRYPFITLDPISATPSYAVDNVSNYTKVWQCSMAFYQLDRSDSTQEDYAKILDFTDELVDQFINKLNFYTQQSDGILITGISQQPFVKVMADYLTGHILTFSIQTEDTFNYCGLGC